jgi:hypothetical protein
MKSIILFICLSISGASVDYTQVWPEDFQYATQFVENQKVTIIEVFQDDLDLAAITLSVGFPEVLRYNAFKDFFETKSLEIAYVKYGLRAVDFSIGEFQMKPSFAEALENELSNCNTLDFLYQELKYNQSNSQNIRNERIARLKNVKWQLIYLRAFTLFMFEKYPKLKEEESLIKVSFLASAYNYGFQSSFKEIENWTRVNAFPHGLKANVMQYAYADIATFYYKNYGKSFATVQALYNE